MSNKAHRLKVLHVIPSIAPCRGGPSKAVIEMVSALRNINIDAEIATTNDNGLTTLDVNLGALINYSNVPVRFFQRYSPHVSALREFGYSASFKTWLRAHIHDYDLIHIHAIFSYCSSIAMLIARKNKVPYVVRPIGQLEDWSLAQSALKKNAYLVLLERANIERASAVHFTAQSERDQALRRFSVINPAVIPLGINPAKPIPNAKALAFEHWQVNPNTPCLAFLSRLHPKKGLEFLLHALAYVKEKQWQLIIAGSGDEDYIETLKDLCSALEITEQVRFVGFIDGDVKNILLQRADLFCLTSYSENFGIAVLEALASGTAALVSRDVALARKIEEHALGFICDLTVDDISAKLALALGDVKQTRHMGNTARDFVAEHYQWSGVAGRLSELYATL